MIALYNLRKEQGNPLLPSDGLVPIIVSMWNIGKGPIDDMSQVLASCLPSFGPINGMCWIWIRTWLMMIFNAWRLYEMKEILRPGEIYGIDDPQSPQRPQRSQLGRGKVTYNMWAEEEVWVRFRITRHPAHVPSNISTLVQ
jgi:hypothetical protein